MSSPPELPDERRPAVPSRRGPLVNAPLLPPLDWVTIGGGPTGCHVAVRLLDEGICTPDRLRILDPGPALLHRWTCCTASTGMRFLRSPAVHHLGPAPFELLQLGGRKKWDRRRSGLFAAPTNRPALSLFARHSAAVLKSYGLPELHVRDRVEHAVLGDRQVRLQLAGGEELRAARVVLALGNSDHPHWPELALELRERGGDVRHVFGETAPIDPAALPAEVAVLGGGISAAQLACRLAAAGRSVTVVARHGLRDHQFDSDPGWIGPKFMRGFLATPDLSERREMIQNARHRGSVPPDAAQDLQAALRSGAVTWRTGALEGGAVGPEGSLTLHIADGGAPLEVGALVLATGFSPRRPGGALVDRLIEDHGLPVADCGYPVVDAQLRWHPRLYVTGPLAELELGPTARNITGGRRAAERIVVPLRPPKSAKRRARSMRDMATAASLALMAAVAPGCQATKSGADSAAGSSDAAQGSGNGEGETDTGAAIQPLPPQGNLLIEEVYYAGAVPTDGIDRYYSDQFIELVNTADAPVMVGGLIIGDAPGLAGVINPGDEPGGPYIADPDHVYLSSAWRIPGEPEDVLLAPGASLVIAQDAGEHKPYSPVDLSEAHYETYVEEHGEDLDDAFVPNLESLWYNGGYDWLVTVFGPTIVVVSIDADELVQVGGARAPVQAPISAVVDTMEALLDAESGDFKRLHESVDSGFVHVSGTYTGESVRRRRDESGRLIDTDDSGADFEVVAVPLPGG